MQNNDIIIVTILQNIHDHEFFHSFRRYLLDLPPKNLLSLDLFHNNTTTTTPEMDSIGELYKLSIDMFKASSAVSSS